jgi:serine/threonine protein kinase
VVNVGVPEIPGFRVHGEIGGSGISAVYLADDELLARRVAVKVLRPSVAADPHMRTRFLREARTLASLDHPHIVHGSDLQTVLDEHGPLAPHRTAEVVRQIASALDHVHARGLVHRDVKPHNVFVARRSADRCYLADFGIATPARQPGSSALGRPDRSAGSPGYGAPEQLAGLPADHRADVFSLGALTLACLTGMHPWRLTDGSVRWDQVRAVLPSAAADIIQTAMAHAPDDRYPACAVFSQELDAWAAQTR